MASIASVVDLVDDQCFTCLFFSNQTFIASTDFRSFSISEKASIKRACVSIGALYQYQPGLFSIQYIPQSSLLDDVSFKLLIIFSAVLESPNRWRTIAAIAF